MSSFSNHYGRRGLHSVSLLLEELEPRYVPDAAAISSIIALVPALPELYPAAVAAAGAAATPPASAYLLGLAAGTAKGIANATTSSISPQQIIENTMHPMTLTQSLLNLADAYALQEAVFVKEVVDVLDIGADELVAISMASPGNLLAEYLGVIGESYKAGEATPNAVSDGYIASFDFITGNTNALPSDFATLSNDLKGNLATDLTLANKAFSDDQAASVEASKATTAAFQAVLNSLNTGSPPPSPSPAQIAITSFVITPANPTTNDTVTATATITGAPPNTSVTLSVMGTDGYTDSTTTDITGTGTATLVIPPGAQGVEDTITLSVPGLPQQQHQVVYH